MTGLKDPGWAGYQNLWSDFILVMYIKISLKKQNQPLIVICLNFNVYLNMTARKRKFIYKRRFRILVHLCIIHTKLSPRGGMQMEISCLLPGRPVKVTNKGNIKEEDSQSDCYSGSFIWVSNCDAITASYVSWLNGTKLSKPWQKLILLLLFWESV